MAEELIEMGRDRHERKPDRSRRPFLAGRRRPSLGAEELIEMGAAEIREKTPDVIDLMANVAPFTAEALSTTLGTIADLSGRDACELSDAATFTDLQTRIPAITRLYASALAAGAVLTRFGLSVRGMSVRTLGKILSAAKAALSEDPDRDALIESAKSALVDAAPEEIQDDLVSLIDATEISGENLTPFVDETGTVSPEATPADEQLL